YHAVDLRSKYASCNSLAFGRAIMDKVSLNLKFLVSSRGLVCKDNQVTNLGAEVFIVCKGTVDKHKESRTGQIKSDILNSPIHVLHLPFKALVQRTNIVLCWVL